MFMRTDAGRSRERVTRLDVSARAVATGYGAESSRLMTSSDRLRPG